MTMRRFHAVQIAREMQRIENAKSRNEEVKPKKDKRGILARLLGKK